jgi:glycosyltransferase involved in cell wall biosynthesis
MISPEFYPEINGVSRAYFHWLQAFVVSGIEVLFISPDYAMHPRYGSSRETELDLLRAYSNFHVHRFPIRPMSKGGAFYSAPKSRRHWHLDAVLEAFGPQIITCDGADRFNGFYFGMDGYGRRPGISVPVVAIFQTDYFEASRAYAGTVDRLLLPFGHRYWSWVLNSYSEVITQSAYYESHLKNRYGLKRVNRVPFIGFDKGVFKAPVSKEFRRDGVVEVLYVGRLSAEKKVEWVIDAFIKIRSTSKNVSLSIVGSGPEEAKLKARCNNIPDIRFHGWKTGDELVQCYQSADVFVSPSPSETFGLTTIEAMACGLPVIGANAGHTPLLIDSGTTGYLFEAGNVDDLAAKMTLLSASAMRRAAFSKASVQKAHDQHDWTQASAKLYKHLEGIYVKTQGAAR